MSQERLADLQTRGVAVLSPYDREVAYGGDNARAILMATQLVRNHISYFTRELETCDPPVQQITLFDATPDPGV